MAFATVVAAATRRHLRKSRVLQPRYWLRLPKGPLKDQRLTCRAEADSQSDSQDVQHGLVLITGGTEGAGQVFAERALKGFSTVHILEPLSTEADADALLERAESLCPDQPLNGFVHFGGACSSTAPAHVDPAGTASLEAVAVLDERLRTLSLLLSRIVPAMRASGQKCRILTVSSEAALEGPSAWIDPMRSLSSGFVEQYTEALAHELSNSNITAYGIRLATGVAECDGNGPNLHGQLAEDFEAVWKMPSAEAHGQIFDVGQPRPEVDLNSARGGSVIGPSIDVRWALRAAAGRAADYPADARPKAYSQLAKALGTDENRIVWCHGASDVIVRVAAFAASRAMADGDDISTDVRALLQRPTWPNVTTLLRSGGLPAYTAADYPDPWRNDDASATFWHGLEKQVLGFSPPALVYLVHPHFPTGVKDPNFGARLKSIVERIRSKTVFAVDQTYLGFTELTEDDKVLENLAKENSSVVLIRSLSKVEGLAAVRLGYALTAPETAKELTSSLPFAGGLYISELALAGAAAALGSGSVEQHRKAVLDFYVKEQAWMRSQMESLGLEAFEEKAPFFCLRAPMDAVRQAIQEGVGLQQVSFPDDTSDLSRRAPAVCLVADRASNVATLKSLAKAMKATESEEKGFAEWAQGLLQNLGA